MRNVLITGGSRGIGAAMVRLFAEKGYRVAFTYKNSDAAARALSEETGALAIKADNASQQDILTAVRKAEENIGSIEILINNAAVSHFGLVTDMTLETWRDVFSINLDAAFLYCKHLLPSMINNRFGRIINISSMWGAVGASCEVCYSSSKAALIGFTKALAKEVGPSQVTVNAIAPGVIDTEMNAALSDSDKEALEDQTPLTRMGSASEVAECALFLASDGASYITGDVMNVSGGFVV